MIWTKLTPEEESLLLALLSHVDQLGHGPDTEFFAKVPSWPEWAAEQVAKQPGHSPDTEPSAPPHQQLNGGGYLHVVGREEYAGVPFRWQTLELLIDLDFVHKSPKTGNYRLRQDAWEYRDWQRLPKLRRSLKALWARNDVQAAVISGIVSLVVSVVVSVIVKLL
jgi:hypothetical protein